MRLLLKHAAIVLTIVISAPEISSPLDIFSSVYTLEYADLADTEGEEDLKNKSANDEVKHVSSTAIRFGQSGVPENDLYHHLNSGTRIHYLDFPTPPPEFRS